MRESLMLRWQMRHAIDTEIAARIKAHQARVAELKRHRANLLSADAAVLPAPPLVLLAHGDSWFDYPLAGNSLSWRSTDIMAQLGRMGDAHPLIINLSHYGDASADELALPRQQRMSRVLQDPTNWINGQPDAILFSAGGNDIVGDHFCIFLDPAASGAAGLDSTRFEKALGMIEASYLDFFAFRDRYAAGVPIFAHSYDFPIPSGVHPECAGPWLKPSLDYAGWNLEQGTRIVRQALLGFRSLLQRLAADPANGFTLIDTQGTLGVHDWANELHPFPDGFQRLARAFLSALRDRFPGRI